MIHLFPNGRVEVPTVRPGKNGSIASYRWAEAYSEVTGTGVSNPLTRKHWREIARRDDKKLRFYSDEESAKRGQSRIKKVKFDTGTVYEVNEDNSLGNIRAKCPNFFSVKFGEDETYTMYRGQLIASCTVKTHSRFGHERSERKSVPYLWINDNDTFCISGNASPKNVREAKKLIDWVLDTGSYSYQGAKLALGLSILD